MVETGRFAYWTGDEDEPLSDGWWFWQQCEYCGYEVPPGGAFETHLKWEVPASATVSTPAGLSVAQAVALELLEDRAPSTRRRLFNLIAEYDLAAGQAALALAAHVAGLELDDG